MLQSFDRHKFKDGQLVCHFRNDYEVNEHCCKTQYTVKFLLKEHVRLSILKFGKFVPLFLTKVLVYCSFTVLTSYFSF